MIAKLVFEFSDPRAYKLIQRKVKTTFLCTRVQKKTNQIDQ